MTEVPERVKEALRLRTPAGVCEGCGMTGSPLDPHHRQPRGMGGVHGAARDLSDDPVNFLALCRWPCHAFTEHEPEAARRLGWVVPHPVDVSRVPAKLWTPQGYGWWRFRYLDDGGPHVAESLDEPDALRIIAQLYGQG